MAHTTQLPSEPYLQDRSDPLLYTSSLSFRKTYLRYDRPNSALAALLCPTRYLGHVTQIVPILAPRIGGNRPWKSTSCGETATGLGQVKLVMVPEELESRPKDSLNAGSNPTTGYTPDVIQYVKTTVKSFVKRMYSSTAARSMILARRVSLTRATLKGRWDRLQTRHHSWIEGDPSHLLSLYLIISPKMLSEYVR